MATLKGTCGAHASHYVTDDGEHVLTVFDLGSARGICLDEAGRRKLASALLHGLPATLADFNVGCPVCSSDCSAANPPVYHCPMRDRPEQELWLLGRDAAGKIYGIKRLNEPFDDGLHADLHARLEAEGSL